MREKAIDWEKYGEKYAKYTMARFINDKYELYNAESGEWEVVKENSHLYDWVWFELLSKDIKIGTEIDLNAKLRKNNETYGYHPYFLHGIYTDGIKEMADIYKAHWLLDIVFTYQCEPKISAEKFQIWTINSKNGKAIVDMKTDTEQPAIVRRDIPLTDFPEGKLTMFLVDGVLFLPSEFLVTE